MSDTQAIIQRLESYIENLKIVIETTSSDEKKALCQKTLSKAISAKESTEAYQLILKALEVELDNFERQINGFIKLN
jgi:hypothetical protein